MQPPYVARSIKADIPGASGLGLVDAVDAHLVGDVAQCLQFLLGGAGVVRHLEKTPRRRREKQKWRFSSSPG